MKSSALSKILTSMVLMLGISSGSLAETVLMNVSYDPTREFYQDFNAAFTKHWQQQGGEAVTIKQSHGGSGKQARSVIDGLRADVVTLALGYDIDAIAEKSKMIPADWQARLPNNSSPYTSTIVFLVRKGNPKQIKDWYDLVKPDIAVITPNPKTSGGARWNYLAAWGYALKHNNNDADKAADFVSRLYKNVAILDSGARGSTTTFVERGLGDVMIAWENEALLAVNKLGEGGAQFEIIIPSLSILAEPPVTVVDNVVDKKGTRKIAEAYLNYLYSDEGQRIAGKHYYRPTNAQIASEFAAQFPVVTLFTVDEVFGGWQKAQQTHFSDGGMFDKIYQRQLPR